MISLNPDYLRMESVRAVFRGDDDESLLDGVGYAMKHISAHEISNALLT